MMRGRIAYSRVVYLTAQHQSNDLNGRASAHIVSGQKTRLTQRCDVQQRRLTASKGARCVNFVFVYEGFLEVVNVDKIFQLIVFGLAHLTGFNQFENHPTEIFRRPHTLFSKHGDRHQPKMLFGEVPDTEQQFSS